MPRGRSSLGWQFATALHTGCMMCMAGLMANFLAPCQAMVQQHANTADHLNQRRVRPTASSQIRRCCTDTALAGEAVAAEAVDGAVAAPRELRRRLLLPAAPAHLQGSCQNRHLQW